MRRIESQREQWPHLVAFYRQADPHPLDNNTDHSTGTTFTDSTGPKVTGTENMTGLEVGTALGVGSAREQAAIDVAKGAAGNKYDYGGSGPGSGPDANGKPATSWDCTGLAADEIKAYTGQDPNGAPLQGADGKRFNTTSPMAGSGLVPGYQPGGLNFSLNPNPGTSGHIMMELPNGQHSESSGRGGVQYGDTAHNMNDPMFTQQWHMPDATQTVVDGMNNTPR